MNLTQTPSGYILTLTNGRGGIRTLMLKAAYSEYALSYQVSTPDPLERASPAKGGSLALMLRHTGQPSEGCLVYSAEPNRRWGHLNNLLA